jgi:hypothetical protein
MITYFCSIPIHIDISVDGDEGTYEEFINLFHKSDVIEQSNPMNLNASQSVDWGMVHEDLIYSLRNNQDSIKITCLETLLDIPNWVELVNLFPLCDSYAESKIIKGILEANGNIEKGGWISQTSYNASYNLIKRLRKKRKHLMLGGVL